MYLTLPRLIFCFCSELRKKVTEEAAAKEAPQDVYASLQRDHDDLEEAAIAACQGVEGEGGESGSSLVSRLRSLGNRVTERLKGAFCLGGQKALGVVSTHYIVDFDQLVTGYIVPDDDDDAKINAMGQADAGAEGATTTLAGLFEGYLFPDDADDQEEGRRNEGGSSNL